MAIFNVIYREENGTKIRGTVLRAYIHNGPYHLTELKVWADGMVDCWELVTFKRFEQKVAEGWVVTALPEGADVNVSPLGAYQATNVHNGVAESELVKEVADLIEELNDRPTAASRCLTCLEAYKDSPNDETKQKLRAAYEAVPAHNRRFMLGDMDVKDMPIRMVLEGEGAIDDWSHRRASKSLGLPLPTLNVRVELERAFPSEKQKLDARLTMALQALYQPSGIEKPLFAKEVLAEVEALFRDARDEAGLERMRSDLARQLAAHSRRPVIVMRLAGAMASLGAWCAHTGRLPTGVDLLLESCRLNPDGMAPIEVAKLAVEQQDLMLCQRLCAAMDPFGLDPVPDEQLATVLGLDVAAFGALRSACAPER